MDIANFVLTFGPAGLVVYSIGKRLVASYKAGRTVEREEELEAPARPRPPLPTHLMLRSRAVAMVPNRNTWEQRSYAAERPTERLGTGIGNSVPALAKHLGTLADDQLLAELALVVNADGSFKYADSRIAKFIGGRVEDRVAQVREVRGVVAPPKKVATKEYPQRTEAQALLRQQLGIGK